MKSIVKLLSLSILTICLASCGTDSNSSSSGFAGFGGGGGGGFGDLIPGIGGGNGTGNNGGNSNNGNTSNGTGINNGNGNSGNSTSTNRYTPSATSFSLDVERSAKYTTTDPKSSIVSDQVSNSVILDAVDALYHNPVTFTYSTNYIFKYYGQDKQDENRVYEGTVQGLSTGEYLEQYNTNMLEGTQNCYARYSSTTNQYYLYNVYGNQTIYSSDEFNREHYLAGMFGSFDTTSTSTPTLHEHVEGCLNDNTLTYNDSLKGYVARINNEETESEVLNEYILKFKNNKLVYYYENVYVRYKAENSSNLISISYIVKAEITSYTSPTSISWPSHIKAEPELATPSGTLSLGTNNLEIPHDWSTYSFTPSTSGTYQFVSSGDIDPKIEIYDGSNTRICTADDIDYNGGNYHFDTSVSLTGGVQYTINLAHWSDGTKSLTLTITKTS